MRFFDNEELNIDNEDSRGYLRSHDDDTENVNKYSKQKRTAGLEVEFVQQDTDEIIHGGTTMLVDPYLVLYGG